jgi:hypothetical protein
MSMYDFSKFASDSKASELANLENDKTKLLDLIKKSNPARAKELQRKLADLEQDIATLRR